MSDINVNWGAAPVPQDYTAAALEGAKAGQEQRAISALQGIDLNDPASVNNGMAGLVRSGATDMAKALQEVAFQRFKNQAYVSSYNSPFLGAQGQSPATTVLAQTAPTQPGGEALPGSGETSPAEHERQIGIMNFGKQSADALLQEKDPTLRKAQADVIEAKAKAMGIPSDFTQSALGDLSDPHLQSLSDNWGQWLEHPSFGGSNPDVVPTIHPVERKYAQAPNRLYDPAVLDSLARRAQLGIDDRNFIEALKAGQGYTGPVAAGDQVEAGGQRTDQAPYAPIATAPGQQVKNTNTGENIGAPVPLPKTLESVPAPNTAVVFNQNTGATEIARDGGGTPAPAASGGTLNNPAGVKALPTGKWPGQTGVDPKTGLVTFDSPSSGYAAADQNLLSYATSHGLNTVQDIVHRWTPAGVDGNPDQSARIAGISHSLGVTPTTPLDIVNNPVLRHQLLAQIISGERPGDMGGGGGGTGAPIAGKTLGAPTTLPGLPGQHQVGFTGEVMPAVPGTYVDPQDARKSMLSNPQVLDAQSSLSNWNAMRANAASMTGPTAMGMLDSMVRAYSGLGARQMNVDALMKTFSFPQQMEGKLRSALLGQGPLTPEMRNQILEAASNYISTRYDTADKIVQGERGAVQTGNGNPAFLDGVLPPKPPPFHITLPPLSERTNGMVIDTPNGLRRWVVSGSQSGWAKVGG